MLDDLKYLNVWDIAHLWLGHDPNHSESKTVPVDVQNILRKLTFEIWRNLNVYDRQGEEIWKWYIPGIPIDISIEPKLRKCYREGIFNKHFLKSLYLDRDEFDHFVDWWWGGYHLPTPSFWFSNLRWDSLDGLEAEEEAVTEAKTEAEKEAALDAYNLRKSENARKAAKKRHEKTERLVDELCHFYEVGNFPSYTAAATKFYDNLGTERKKLLAPTNAIRTLREGLSRRINHREEPPTSS